MSIVQWGNEDHNPLDIFGSSTSHPCGKRSSNSSGGRRDLVNWETLFVLKVLSMTVSLKVLSITGRGWCVICQ